MKEEEIYTPEELKAFQKLKEGALAATDYFSEDELEEYARLQGEKGAKDQ